MTDTAEKLTQLTNNRIDFYNIGGLALQRTKDSLWGLWENYSWRELMVRGGILSTTIVMGLLTASTCKDDQCSSSMRGLVGGAVGFFVSHTVAIIPTIQRRNKIIKDTENYKAHINQALKELLLTHSNTSHYQDMSTLSSQIDSVCEKIMNLELPVQKRGDAATNLTQKKIWMKAAHQFVSDLTSTLKTCANTNKTISIAQALSIWNQQPKAVCAYLEENLTKKPKNSAMSQLK